LTASFQVASALEIQSSPTFLVNNRETFNAQDPAGIEAPFCKHNPGLAGCSKQLSGAAPTQQAPSRARPRPPRGRSSGRAPSQRHPARPDAEADIDFVPHLQRSGKNGVWDDPEACLRHSDAPGHADLIGH